MASMKPFFEQAERKLIYDQKDNAENEWLDKVCSVPTSQPLLPAEINKSIFTEISQALFYNKYLAIEYINQTGKSIKGRIMPLALAQQGASLYLVARFDGHDNERHLALHRFKSAEMSTMSFVRPKEFDLKKYQADARFGFGAGKKIKLRFSISHWAGFHLTETKLSKDQKILEETDEYYRFEATVIESEMLDWWLLKFGDEVWEIDKIYLD